MQGWMFTKTDEPLKWQDLPDPVPAEDEVVIEVKAAGLCRTDVGIMHDPAWMPLVSAPVILGHENAGIIKTLGSGVTGFKVGDRVGVAPQDKVTGKTVGAQRNGGYADLMAVPARELIPLPDEVSFEQGAAATDAGMSSYHPLFEVGGARKGMTVGIIGAGGLGQFAVNMALIEGCHVCVADTSPKAREWAGDLGVRDVHEQVLDLKDDEPDLVVDFAGFGTTTNDAISVVRPGGMVVLVGMGRLQATIDTRPLITRNVTLRGNNGGTPDDIAQVYRYFQTGKMKPSLVETTFADIPEGLETLRKGGVTGRMIALR